MSGAAECTEHFYASRTLYGLKEDCQAKNSVVLDPRRDLWSNPCSATAIHKKQGKIDEKRESWQTARQLHGIDNVEKISFAGVCVGGSGESLQSFGKQTKGFNEPKTIRKEDVASR